MPAEVIYLRREKVVLDTSVYIRHLNQEYYTDLIADLIRSSIFYLHSLVFEELLAGVRSDKETKDLHQLKKAFRKSDRLVTPTDQDWEETGLLINRLIRRQNLASHQAVSLTHDVLLALSSRRLGMRLVTENRKDFERIKALKDFKLTIWSPS